MLDRCFSAWSTIVELVTTVMRRVSSMARARYAVVVPASMKIDSPGLHQRPRGPADGFLLGASHRLAHAVVNLDHVLADERAAVGPRDELSFLEAVQVAADGHFRNAQVGGELGDAAVPFAREDLHHLFIPFLHDVTPGSLPDRPRGNGNVPRRAFQGGKAQGQAVQVSPGPVLGLAFFLDGAKKLAHGPVEPVREPRAAQTRSGNAPRGGQGHFLRVQVGAGAADGSQCPGDARRVLLHRSGCSHRKTGRPGPRRIRRWPAKALEAAPSAPGRRPRTR